MFAKFLYLAPFIFGFVPGFTLQGDLWDIVNFRPGIVRHLGLFLGAQRNLDYPI